MGPGRFRNKLKLGKEDFREALRKNDKSKFLDKLDDIRVKSTDTKSRVLKMFTKHQLLWFPVVDSSDRPIGIIEPARLAVSVLTDIAEVLSDN